MARKAKAFPDLAAKARYIREKYGDDPEVRQLADELDPYSRLENLQLVYKRRPIKTPFDDLEADVQRAVRGSEVAVELDGMKKAGQKASVKKAINRVAARRGCSIQTIQDAWDSSKPDRYLRPSKPRHGN